MKGLRVSTPRASETPHRPPRRGDLKPTNPAESPRIAWVDATSERPIAITWRLEHELPDDIFASYRAA